MPNWVSDILSEIRYRFRVVFRKRAVERELDDEPSSIWNRKRKSSKPPDSLATRRIDKPGSHSAASNGSRTTPAT